MTPAKTEWVKKMIDDYGEHVTIEAIMSIDDYSKGKAVKMVEETKVAYTIADRVIDDLLGGEVC